MKKQALLALVILNGLFSASAYAGLTSTQSERMATILQYSGLKPQDGKILGFDLFCEATSFGVNNCMIATQSSDPATHRAEIPGRMCGEFWSLMKSAGAQQFVSQVADGTAGHWVILADSIECSLDASGTQADCAIKLEPRP